MNLIRKLQAASCKNLKMPRNKRGKKGKADAQKKGTKKRDASTSSGKLHSQNKPKCEHTGDSSPVRPEGHVQPSTESEPHTQKSSGTVEKWTQTKPVKQATQQTQTEFNDNKDIKEAIEESPEEDKMEVVTQRNQGNEGDGEDENGIKKKKRKVSEPMEAEEKRTKLSDGCGDKQAGDEQKDTETKGKHSREDSQKGSDLKSGTEGKSNAEAAGNQTKVFSDNKDSKEAIEQSPEGSKMEVDTQLQRNQGNESDGKDEKCIEKERESRNAEEKRSKPSDVCKDKQDGDKQKDTDPRSGSEGRKSYAEAASPGIQTNSETQQRQQRFANLCSSYPK